MKKFFFVCILFLFAHYGNGQIIKIGNGISITHLSNKKFNFFNNNITTYNAFAGVEYFNKKWFYISSEIGYIKIGGKDDGVINIPNSNFTEKWSFVQLNTTFRIKNTTKNVEVYVGAGPYLNILASSKNFKDSLYKEYNIKNTNFGLKPEIGINENIGKLKLGLNGSYLINISPLLQSQYAKIGYKDILVSLSIGYKFK